MKKISRILAGSIFIMLFLSSGVALSQTIPVHGHTGPDDGGVLPQQGVLMYVYGPTVTLTNDVATFIPFTAEQYDTGNFHSTTTNPDRLPVPSGYSYVQMTCQLLIYTAVASTSKDYLNIMDAYLNIPIGAYNNTSVKVQNTSDIVNVSFTTGLIKLSSVQSYLRLKYVNNDPYNSKYLQGGTNQSYCMAHFYR